MISGGPNLPRTVALHLVGMLLLLGCGDARAQGCVDYSEQASWVGPLADESAAFDHLCYSESGFLAGMTRGRVLKIFNCQDPAAPQFLGSRYLDFQYSSMACSGDYIYLGGAPALGIEVFQVGQDGTIAGRGSFCDQQAVLRFDVDDDVLVSIGIDSWSVWDCSNPAAPQLAASVSEGIACTEISIDGDRVAVAYDNARIRIYDISERHDPLPLGDSFLSPLGQYSDVQGLHLAGDVLGIDSSRYFAVDVSDPQDIVTLGSLDCSAWGGGRVGTRLYATCEQHMKSWVVDTDDVDPVALKFVPAGGYVITGTDDYLYIGSWDGGITIWRAPRTMQPGQCSASATGDYDYDYICDECLSFHFVQCVDSSDDYIATSLTHYWEEPRSSDYLSWIDVYNPEVSVESPWVRINDSALTLRFEGTRLYYRSDYETVRCVDVSDPASVLSPTQLDCGYDCRSLAVISSSVIAVGRSDEQLDIFDVSDLADPQLISSVPVNARVLIRDGPLLVALGGGYLTIVDVRDPAAPIVRGRCLVDEVGPMTCLGNRVLIKLPHRYTIVDYSVHHSPHIAVASSFSPTGIPIFFNGTPNPYEVAAADGQLYLPGCGIHVLSDESLSPLGSIAAEHNILAAVTWRGQIYGVGADMLTEIPKHCGTEVSVALSSVRLGLDEGIPVLAWTLSHPTGAERFAVAGEREGTTWDVAVFALTDGAYEARDTSPSAAIPGEATYNLYEIAGITRTLLASEHIVLSGLSPALHLSPVTPNPFNPRTTVVFDLPLPQRADLSVYDAAGRLVRRLAVGDLPAGSHTAAWDGRDDRGGEAPSGAYFLRLSGESGSVSRKAVLLR